MELQNAEKKAVGHCALFAGRIAAATAAAIFFAVCSTERGSETPAFNTGNEGQSADTGRIVCIGVTGMESPRSTFRRYMPLIDYIGAKLQCRVQLVQRRAYSEMNRLFTEEKLHFAFLSAGAYIHLREAVEPELLAAAMPESQTPCRSVVIVRAASPIEKLAQLKGKPFAFVDTLSLSGYASIVCALAGRQCAVHDFFSSVTMSGSHDNALRLVYGRRASAACVSSNLLGTMQRENEGLARSVRVIYESKDLPFGPVVAQPGLPDEMSAKVKEVLLSMEADEQGRAVLRSMNFLRFTAATDEDYAGARSIIACSQRSHI